jgi:hypothetical protein
MPWSPSSARISEPSSAPSVSIFDAMTTAGPATAGCAAAVASSSGSAAATARSHKARLALHQRASIASWLEEFSIGPDPCRWQRGQPS